ncbi:protein of unknown function [Methylacidimicrobium sp. AP8]|uniref:hypothetical protein n=1 Tax=Methylacidimicrobium sp. AP8 TaxID=2730359 RepID=UPI0018C1A5A2|nr:hypothetical protein [Methylacidimicrobium sp. AP8]CAB4243729.1 protein of unknown function [Methylacidimicrobium sp. AP8]
MLFQLQYRTLDSSDADLGMATVSAPDFDSFVKDLFSNVPLPSSEDGAGEEE